MTSAATNSTSRRMLLNTHYLLDGLGRYHSVDEVAAIKPYFPRTYFGIRALCSLKYSLLIAD